MASTTAAARNSSKLCICSIECLKAANYSAHRPA
jgi:hypothetical protein